MQEDGYDWSLIFDITEDFTRPDNFSFSYTIMFTGQLYVPLSTQMKHDERLYMEIFWLIHMIIEAYLTSSVLLFNSIYDILISRQGFEKRVVSQDLQLWLSNVSCQT